MGSEVVVSGGKETIYARLDKRHRQLAITGTPCEQHLYTIITAWIGALVFRITFCQGRILRFYRSTKASAVIVPAYS